MNYIIQRRETKNIAGKKQWLIVYGRRKVGKTFLLKELCGFDNYYTVKTDLSILSNKGTIALSIMLEQAKQLLSENKTLVIDEFQRLGNNVLEELTLLHPKGRLILSGSSQRVIKKVFEPKSPFLGFFMPLEIGFISPQDMLLNLKGKFGAEKAIELAAFMREPWTIPGYSNEKAIEFVYNLVVMSRYTISALIGEIFTEEERELSKKYEAVISLIGSGTWNTKELASILYSRGLIPDAGLTHISQYLKNLESMGLVESIKLHKKKGRFYRLASPIMNIYYYLDSRYDIGERKITLNEIRPTLEKLFNLEIQNFIADIFSEAYGGRKEYFVRGDREVDFIITKRNKPEIIGEVKWGKISSEDISKFRKNSAGLQGKRVLVCKSGALSAEDIEFVEAENLLALAK